jgi:hypothetical protein
MALDITTYRTHLRAFMKDHKTLNRLLKFAEENSDDEMDMYIYMSLGFLNSVPPIVNSYDLATFPTPSLLIHQATVEALISNGILYARNDLTYNNGGITVRISDGDRYLKHLQLLFRMTDREIKNFTNIKIAINIDGGFGGVHSPYGQLHGSGASLQANSILSDSP